MINLPLHYSIHRDSHPAAQNLPAQFYLYYLTAHISFPKLPLRFSCERTSMTSVDPVNGYRRTRLVLPTRLGAVSRILPFPSISQIWCRSSSRSKNSSPVTGGPIVIEIIFDLLTDNFITLLLYNDFVFQAYYITILFFSSLFLKELRKSRSVLNNSWIY